MKAMFFIFQVQALNAWQGFRGLVPDRGAGLTPLKMWAKALIVITCVMGPCGGGMTGGMTHLYGVKRKNGMHCQLDLPSTIRPYLNSRDKGPLGFDGRSASEVVLAPPDLTLGSLSTDMRPTSSKQQAQIPDRCHEGITRLLVVEDEVKTAEFLRQGLSEHGFEVEIARDGEAGLVAIRSRSHDLIILDVGLPGRDGWSVLGQLRSEGIHAPVLFLSAHDAVADRVRGLEVGADDYLIKPFAFAELIARIRTLLLRGGSPRSLLSLTVADLSIDLLTTRVTRAGVRLDLSQTELGVLIVLMRYSPMPVSRRQLSEKVWDVHFDSTTNVVDVAVNRLRGKVDGPFPQPLIRSIRAIGYVCLAPGESPSQHIDQQSLGAT